LYVADGRQKGWKEPNFLFVEEGKRLLVLSGKNQFFGLLE
jgi:hypothetical protein